MTAPLLATRDALLDALQGVPVVTEPNGHVASLTAVEANRVADALAGVVRDPTTLDVWDLREAGHRVLGDEQCCEKGCNGGGCETCPCCSAGWCVTGVSGVPGDAEDRTRWLQIAAPHNPVAAVLKRVDAELAAMETWLGDDITTDDGFAESVGKSVVDHIRAALTEDPS